ncbi:UNVERIFIED_CONTAM: hypothetical protein GTU68_016318 [Idotea baltica]|nr:hypothetical protein [Idotea baltica]
MELLKGTCV